MRRFAMLALAAPILLLAGCNGSLPGFGTPIKGAKPEDETVVRPIPAPTKAPAQVTELEGNRFQVALANFEAAAVEQQRSDWCWAACIESVLDYENNAAMNRRRPRRAPGADAESTQVALIRQFHLENKQNQSGSLRQIQVGLCPEHKNHVEQLTAGRMQLDLWGPNVGNQDMLVNDLSQGHPIIAGLRDKAVEGSGGHAVVIFAATYSRRVKSSLDPLDLFGGSNAFVLHEVRYIDPLQPNEPKSLQVDKLSALADFVVSRPFAQAETQKYIQNLQQSRR